MILCARHILVARKILTGEDTCLAPARGATTFSGIKSDHLNVVAPLAGARFVYSSRLPGRFIVFYPIADVVLRCVE